MDIEERKGFINLLIRLFHGVSCSSQRRSEMGWQIISESEYLLIELKDLRIVNSLVDVLESVRRILTKIDGKYRS